jgi:hypothetical protein
LNKVLDAGPLSKEEDVEKQACFSMAAALLFVSGLRT